MKAYPLALKRQSAQNHLIDLARDRICIEFRAASTGFSLSRWSGGHAVGRRRLLGSPLCRRPGNDGRCRAGQGDASDGRLCCLFGRDKVVKPNPQIWQVHRRSRCRRSGRFAQFKVSSKSHLAGKCFTLLGNPPQRAALVRRTTTASSLSHVGQLMAQKRHALRTLQTRASCGEVDILPFREGVRSQLSRSPRGFDIGVDANVPEIVVQKLLHRRSLSGPQGSPCPAFAPGRRFPRRLRRRQPSTSLPHGIQEPRQPVRCLPGTSRSLPGGSTGPVNTGVCTAPRIAGPTADTGWGAENSGSDPLENRD